MLRFGLFLCEKPKNIKFQFLLKLSKRRLQSSKIPISHMDVLIPNSSLICQEKLEDEVMLTETENVFSKMRECSLAQIPSYNKLTIETFVELCKIHQRFIEKSVVFDIYLLAHAFLLLDKANLADEDLTDHYFFSALYLATGTFEIFSILILFSHR